MDQASQPKQTNSPTVLSNGFQNTDVVATRSRLPVRSPAQGGPLATTGSYEHLFASVRELEPLIRAHQASADQLRCMPEEVLNAFFERDLFRILLPSDLGGGGVDLLTSMLLVEAVSAIDGSMGWIFEIGIGSLVRLGFLPVGPARQLANEPRAFVAGTFPPVGRAGVVPGGFMVSGQWPFASGIHHARWVAAGCRVYDDDIPRTTSQGGTEVVHVYMPKAALTILDTWHVGGMRGTGSNDYAADNVFVPDELTTFPADRRFASPAPILRILDTTLGTAFGFVALGIARGTLEGLIELANTQTSLQSDGKALRERDSTAYEIAKAEAMLEGARSSLIEAVRAVADAAQRGEPVELPGRARLRRAQVHAGETAVDIVDRLYRTTGAAALFEWAPIERRLRDVHALVQQGWLQPATMEDAGRVRLGLAPRRRNF
jgi:alkylation response protein AidB-like acyl-CoA dehydrogenase